MLTTYVNQSIDTSNFPDYLKTANITPVFKKDDPLDKLNFRPAVVILCEIFILKNLSLLIYALVKNSICVKHVMV